MTKKHTVKQPDKAAENEIVYANHIFKKEGERMGKTVEICYIPHITAEVIGYNAETAAWLVEHIFDNGSRGGYSVLTEAYISATESERQ